MARTRKADKAFAKAKKDLRDFWRDHERLYDSESFEAQTFFETDFVDKYPKDLSRKIRRMAKGRGRRKR